MKKLTLTGLIFLQVFFSSCCHEKGRNQNQDLLASWNEGPAKKEIIAFVKRITDSLNADYVKPSDRIAVFDNDGTLLCEKPNWFQMYFMIDRVRKLAADHPEWKTKQPWKAILEHDTAYLANLSNQENDEICIRTQVELTQEELTKLYSDFYMTAKHPRFHALFTDLTYHPMMQLLHLLEMKGFRNYIVTGGGIEFVRSFSERIYKIPPEQVIGTHFQYAFTDSTSPSGVKLSPTNYTVVVKEEKPDNIALVIGKRPVIAVGNSNGDLQMLEYTDDRKGPSLQILIHHDDAIREYAYDDGAIQALQVAAKRKWTVVSMKNDFKVIFR
jgi:phosphoglycolate phosphatase-like HAD superfamily hydrolase